MTLPLAFAPRALQWSLLRAASLLAPARLRAEWRREWRAELWHVRRARAPVGAFSFAAERELTAFCLGAFQDAICLRRQPRDGDAHPSTALGSPGHCLLALVAALALGFFVSLALPGVRAKARQPHLRLNSGVILIHSAGAANSSAASIAQDRFRAWNSRPQRFFDDMAFYRMAREGVSMGATDGMRWNVAHASGNLFSLLGVPLRLASSGGASSSQFPALILGCAVFEREFGGNARVVGGVLQFRGIGAVRIAGVAPCADLGLPGRVDAWLLEPPGGTVAGAPGFVVARLSAAGRAEMSAQGARIAAHDGTGDMSGSDDDGDSPNDLIGTPLAETVGNPWSLYLFAVFLAFLCLPAVTSVSMAESSFSSHRPSRQAQLCRAGFLAAKVALLLPIAWVLPLDLAWGPAISDTAAHEYVQLIATFCICLFGVRWVLLDQRRRCPVCLRRVTHPAQVGSASRTFLDWNGTEMMCMGGHTLLHVPGLPTSWFATQRWLYLDNSWDFLFAASSDG
jgi:hypothetical protein